MSNAVKKISKNAMARQNYKKYVFHGSENARFTLAELGNDAGIVGAAGMIINK